MEERLMAQTITVRVRAFALLREALGAAELAVTLPAGADVAALLVPVRWRLSRRKTAGPALHHRRQPELRAARNGPGGRGRGCADPPVSGGSTRLFEIVDRTISLDDVAARVAAPENGAITLFAGAVRGVTEGRPGKPAR